MAHRKGRSFLTGAGIALGVAILFGVLVANATTQQGIDDFFEDITGRADVVVEPVGTFDANLPPGTLDALAGLPGVADAVGQFGFPTALAGYPSPNDPDQPAPVRLAGVVLQEAEKVQSFELANGAFPRPGYDELLLSAPPAEDLGLTVGDTLEIRGRAQTRQMEVVGVLDPTGAGTSWDGWVIYTSMETARALDGAGPDDYRGVFVILEPGFDVDTWIDEHRGAIDGVQLQNAATIAQGFRDFVTLFGLFLAFFAAITLFVGAFLIYLTLSMAVIERTRLYGTLRALGASRKQVRRVVLIEALALGSVSTLAGLLLGLLLAVGLLALITAFFDIEMPGLVVTPASALVAVLVGLAVTAGSALIPSVRAGRLAPIEAMKGDFVRDTKLGRAWMAGAVVFVFGLAVQVSTGGSGSGLGALGVIGILLGAVLLVPLLLRPLASLLGRLTTRLARGVGDIAVLHLAKERSRSAYTLALVMVVMVMVFATGGLFLSIRGTVDELIDRQFGVDLFLFPRTPQAGDFESVLRGQPDVADVSPVRMGIVEAIADGRRDQVFVRTIDPESYFRVSSYYWTDGSDQHAIEALTGGGSVLVSDEVKTMFRLDRGETLTIETAAGPVDFEVAAIYSPQFGPPELTMGLPDAQRYLSSGPPVGYLVDVDDGSDPRAVGNAIRTSLPDASISFETAADFREQARSQLATFFQIVYAILAIAAIVGLLGLANTLAMSVLQRFREIGILRSVGVTRSQIRRMVLVESVTMGLTAFVLSLPLGWVLTYLFLRGASDGFGFTIDVVYPWTWIPFVAIFGLVVATAAAIAPGRRAARLEVVSALQYE